MAAFWTKDLQNVLRDKSAFVAAIVYDDLDWFLTPVAGENDWRCSLGADWRSVPRHIGAQVEGRDLALEGVTAELDNGDKARIEIVMGAKRERHVTHTITDPIEVSLEHTDEGADHALAIKSADEAMTLLRFRSAIRPEMVDAMVW